MSGSAVDREAVHEEMERARAAFHQLLDNATEADLRRPTDGTRWTNEQLLFHMLFGYILIRPLLVLVSSLMALRLLLDPANPWRQALQKVALALF